MDVVFRGATVVDGTGSPGVVADVGVADGRIAAVGSGLSARRTVDAGGLVLAPGFIDMHAHSDLHLLTHPEHAAKVTQGVTLEVIGQDGLSYAPVDDATLAAMRDRLAGWNDDPQDLDWSWRSVGGYLDRLDEGIAVNAAYLLPQGTIRHLVMGARDRRPTVDELDRMRAVVAQGMREGAVGMSSGLTYVPGMYADRSELAALCEVVAAHGGYYSPHHRSYGAGALEAYREMLDVAQMSGCPLHLAHATMNFGVNAGRAGELVALLDDAISAGADVTLDSYPYLPGATSLAALLPGWAADGGVDATLARLLDPAQRERIRRDVEEVGSDGCHGVPVDWATIEVNAVRRSANEHLVGHSIGASAAAAGVAPFELFADVLVDERLGTGCLMHVGDEANVRTIMQHPAHTGGSDGLLAGHRPHPRAWGTFPRYLARYVRDLGVLGLEECVAHLTGRAARRLRLRDRGLVRPGHAADLVLFDPATVADTATVEQPRQRAEGIPFVLVNGTFVVDDGVTTGALPGHAIRGAGCDLPVPHLG